MIIGLIRENRLLLPWGQAGRCIWLWTYKGGRLNCKNCISKAEYRMNKQGDLHHVHLDEHLDFMTNIKGSWCKMLNIYYRRNFGGTAAAYTAYVREDENESTNRLSSLRSTGLAECQNVSALRGANAAAVQGSIQRFTTRSACYSLNPHGRKRHYHGRLLAGQVV